MTRSHLPPLDALDLVVAVSRSGSIGSAARELGISQQSASERLAAVERQVGVPLLHRTARGTGLTDAGRVVVEWAARLLEVADEVEASITTLRTRRDRRLRVAASMTIAEHVLPRWLAALRRRDPDTAPAITLVAANSTEVMAAVRAQRADLGFVEGLDRPRGLAGLDVATDELVLVVAPPDPLTRRRRPLTPDEVATLALTLREAGSGTRDVVDHALAEHGLTARPPAVEVTTATALRASVLAGGPPAFVSRRTVETDLATGALVELPVTGLALTRAFRAIWVGARQPPAGPIRDLLAVARRAG